MRRQTAVRAFSQKPFRLTRLAHGGIHYPSKEKSSESGALSLEAVGATSSENASGYAIFLLPSSGGVVWACT